MVIGYYIHDHGRGHLARATAIAAALDTPITGLSSLSRPADWAGDWVQLPSDICASAVDPKAGGRLHWAPTGHPGLRKRMSRIAQWIGDADPRAFVTDVSVEVGLLARLHGVPVISVAMPGHRNDPAHTLGFDISAAVIGAWPPEARGMLTGLPVSAQAKIIPVGAISRFARHPLSRPATTPHRPRHVIVLGGAGGDDFTDRNVRDAREQTPLWTWTHLGASGTWTPNPWDHLMSADVVVSHAGESAIADISAARRPAVIVAQRRPYREQSATSAVLAASSCPVVVRSRFRSADWADLLDSAGDLDGDRWLDWNDGGGAQRAAAVITRVARSEWEAE